MLWSLLMSANLDPELRVPSLTCILGTVPVLIAELIKIDLFHTIVSYIFGILKLHPLCPVALAGDATGGEGGAMQESCVH